MPLLSIALKLTVALVLFVAPGLLTVYGLRIARTGIQILPMSFGISLIFLTLLNIPLVFFHLNAGWLLGSWCIFGAILSLVVTRKLGLTAIQTDFSNWFDQARQRKVDAVIGWTAFALLSLLAVCLFMGAGYIGGEEEMELIITRKLLENPFWTFDNTLHVPHVVPTYLLTPLYLFRTLLSSITGLDPVILHYRLGFIPPVMAILSLASIVQVVTASSVVGLSVVVLGALCALLSPLSTLAHSPFILPGWYGAPSLPPPSAFYRATVSVQIATPTCILFMLLALTEKHRWKLYAGLFLLMLFTTVQIHATAVLYLMGVLGLFTLACLTAAVGHRFKNEQSNSQLLRGTFLIILAAGLLFTYKQCFSLVHQDIESLEMHQRQFMVADLRNCFHSLRSMLILFPESIYRFDYFKYRGARYDSLWIEVSGAVNPPLLLGFACSYLYLLFRRHVMPIFLFSISVGFPLFARIPLTSILALMLSPSIFNDLGGHLSFFVYMTLFLTALLIGNFISTWLVKARKRRIALFGILIIATIVSFYVVGAIAEYLKLLILPHRRDRTFVEFLAGMILIAFSLLIVGKQPLRWDFSKWRVLPTLLVAAALVLPVVLRKYDGQSHTVLGLLRHNIVRLAKVQHPYDQYAQNVWPFSNLTEGLFDCLMFVRGSIPKQQLFAADPAVIRTIPLMTDEYIVHSGVPYDFVEPYFLRYYKPKVKEYSPGLPMTHVVAPDSEEVPYRAEDPFFQRRNRLSTQALEQDADFCSDFRVNYVLFTPAFHEHLDDIFENLRRRRLLDTTKVYDKAGYAIYRIDRVRT